MISKKSLSTSDPGVRLMQHELKDKAAMIKIAKNIQNLPHSPTLWANDLVHEKRGKGETVYHMGFGESPFPVPERLRHALSAAAHRCEYLPAQGLKDLIEAVRSYYRPLVGDAVVDGSDVIIAPGSKLILYALQMAIEGDLLMPVPSWVSYGPQAQMLGSNVIKLHTRLDDQGYHIDPQQLRDTIRKARSEGKNPTKIILNSPNNPTGQKIPDSELSPIAEICRSEGIFIISDEIYGLVSFDGKYSSIAPYAPEITAITTGLSKHLSIGGWRFGVGFIPKGVDGLYAAMRHIISETWSCVAAPIQQAAIAAYQRHQDIEDHIAACTAIHKLMNTTISNGLKAHGLYCPMAQGAFYNYVNFAPFKDRLAAAGIKTSQDIHHHLLQRYNLATLPGTGFGAAPDVLTLRLSGCDYNGAAALNAYLQGAPLDQAFVAQYAPNILRSIEIFGAFLDDAAKEGGLIIAAQ